MMTVKIKECSSICVLRWMKSYTEIHAEPFVHLFQIKINRHEISIKMKKLDLNLTNKPRIELTKFGNENFWAFASSMKNVEMHQARLEKSKNNLTKLETFYIGLRISKL